MKKWKWIECRQKECRYMKMCLYSFRIFRLGMDAYLLKYQADTILPEHKDIVNGRHWRLNIGWGVANFVCEKYIIAWRIGKLTVTLFRPDKYLHSLYVFEKTVKLSLGFAILSK